MSRQTKLTPKVHAAIVALLRHGVYQAHAAATVGVSESSLRRWLARAESPDADEPFASFGRDVAAAQAHHASRLQKSVTRAAAKDWRAAAWDLERRYPRLYGVESRTSVAVGREVEALFDCLEAKLDAQTFRRVLVAAAESDAVAQGGVRDAYCETPDSHPPIGSR